LIGYRVYQPIQTVASASRTTLRKLGADFEAAYVTVTTSLTLDGVSAANGPFDVTSMIPLASSNASVVNYSQATRTVQGVGVGVATLSFGSGVSLAFSVSSLAG